MLKLAIARIAIVALAAPAVAALTIWVLTSGSCTSPSPSPANPATETADDVAHARERTPHGRREPGACAVTFADAEAHLSDETLALAVLDSVDPETNQTATTRGDAEDAFTVTSCRGTRVQAWPSAGLGRGRFNVVASLVAGAPERVVDAGLGSKVVARVVVGEVPGICSRPKGFLALATLRGGRLEVDALSEWEGTCDSIEPMSAMRFGADVALLEADGDTGEEATHMEWERVWLRRGAELVRAGDLRTRFEETREPWPVPGIHRTMTAEIEPSAKGVTVRETWALESVDGGPSRTKLVERPYWIEGSTLRTTPAPDPR